MSGMMIVVQLLVADSGIVAAVTSQAIHPVIAPQNAQLPYVVVTQVAGVDGLHLGGQNQYPRHRVMVESIAQSAAAAQELGDLAKDALRDVIKAVVGKFKDVDVTEAGPELVDHSDDRQAYRHIDQFYVQFRRA